MSEASQKGQLPNLGNSLHRQMEYYRISPYYPIEHIENGEDGTIDLVRDYMIYVVEAQHKSNPIFAVDSDSYLDKKRKHVSLRPLELDQGETIVGLLPPVIKKKMAEKALLWNCSGDINRLASDLVNEQILTSPIPPLKDLSILDTFKWEDLVSELVAFNGVEPDPRLKTVRKCTTMRGFRPELNCHSIISLPGQTGRSDYYELAGTVTPKATATGLIGYARSPNEIFPGALDRDEYPHAIDQVESQQAWQLFRYLFNIMETGKALIEVGGAQFWCKSLSPLICIANPAGVAVKGAMDFWSLLEKITTRQAMGRRFGTILYDTEAKRIPRREGNKELWASYFQFFRAVEETALPKLREIYASKEVWDWCNTKIEGFFESGSSIITDLDEPELHAFLMEFLSNCTSHLMGGAFSAVILDNLGDIVRGKYDIHKLLNEAEVYVSELVDISLKSLGNITQNFTEQKTSRMLLLYNGLPKYLKTIVNALELFRRNNQDKPIDIVTISSINYTPNKEKEGFKYLSEAIKEAQKGNPSRYNNVLKDNYGFEIFPEEKPLKARYLDFNPRPELLGILGNLGNLGDMGDPLFGEKTPNSENEGEVATPKDEKNLVSNNPKMPKIPKTPQKSTVPTTDVKPTKFQPANCAKCGAVLGVVSYDNPDGEGRLCRPCFEKTPEKENSKK